MNNKSTCLFIVIYLLSQACLCAQEKSIRFDKLREYGDVRAMTFCYGGQHICMATRDSVLNVCRLDDGHVIMSTKNADYQYEEYSNHITRYDTRTRRGNRLEVVGFILDTTFSKDGEYVIISELGYSDSNIMTSLYKSSTGECLGILPYDGEVFGLFVDDAIVLCSLEEGLLLWNIVESSYKEIPINNAFKIFDVVFKYDWNEILLFNSDGGVYKLDLNTLLLQKCDFTADGLVDIACADNGYWATLSDEGIVKIWNEDKKLLLVDDGISGLISRLAFLPGGESVKIDMQDGTAYVLYVDGSKYKIKGYNTYLMRSTANDGKILLASYDAVYVIDFLNQFMLDTGVCKYSEDSYVEDFSPSGASFFTISESGALCVYDIMTSEKIVLPKPYQSSVAAASYAPDGSHLIVALTDGKLLMWNLLTREISLLPFDIDDVHGISFSPNGRSIIVVSGNSAKIYDLVSCELVSTPIYHNGRINSAVFSQDGRYVITASQDYTVQIWDAEADFSQLYTLFHEGPVYTAEFSEDGEYLAVLDFFGTCHIFRIMY